MYKSHFLELIIKEEIIQKKILKIAKCDQTIIEMTNERDHYKQLYKAENLKNTKKS
jgi:hypothetical protein